MNFLFLYICVIWTFWFVRQEKIAFFYIYFWQLKEYHWGRFIDHFRTEKGKRLIFHPLKIVKLAILLSYWFLNYFNFAFIWLGLVFAVYGLEFLITLKDLNNGTLKKPVPTLKTRFLTIAISLLFSAILIYTFLVEMTLLSFAAGLPLTPIFALLVIDVLSPIIISGFILALQPLSTACQLIIIAKAKNKRLGFKNLVVIGIAGSYGKTSTKELLYDILSKKFNVLKTADHQNSEIGIANHILKDLKPEHQVFICEMGAYNKGKIKQVTAMALPEIGIVCGINEQHLALFKTMENLISAEGGKELLKSLPDNGMAILNEDSDLIQNSKSKIQNYNPKIKIKFCSTKQKTDLWAENIRVEKEWLYFKICDKAGESADLKINLAGRQNIENILLAAAGAKELGMTPLEIAKACEKIKPDHGSLKLVLNQVKHKADIIDSTYSANPDGVIAALEHLKLWSGKKVIVMPCLIELGKASKQVHFEIGKKIGRICDLAIIVTKDRFEELRGGAISAGLKSGQIIFLENPKQIAEKLNGLYPLDSVILLEGRLPKTLLSLITK